MDVWTFNDKFKSKLSPKNLKQFVKGGSENQNSQHKLIGSVEVPLNKVPASGFNKFWQIEKLISPDQKVRIVIIYHRFGIYKSSAFNVRSSNTSDYTS